MSASASADPWVWLARIRRPQGRKGEVFADILTDFPEKFAERRRLWLLPDSDRSNTSAAVAGSSSPPSVTRRPGTSAAALTTPREIELANHWLHKGGIVFHFAGVDSISDAEKLAGLIVAVPRQARVALTEDEVYIGDLIGCTLVDVGSAAAVVVGAIEDVDRSAGPVPLLVIGNGADEILVPFAKSYLRTVDLEAKRVEMALPDGLIDLNSPEKSK
jgi:16S rRNA processing protein RimM